MNCPKCNSSVTTEVEHGHNDGFYIVPDRECQECGHRFEPPIPAWAPFGLAIVAAAGFVFVIWTWLSFAWAPKDFMTMRNVPMLVVLSVAVFGGCGTLLTIAARIWRGEIVSTKIWSGSNPDPPSLDRER